MVDKFFDDGKFSEKHEFEDDEKDKSSNLNCIDVSSLCISSNATNEKNVQGKVQLLDKHATQQVQPFLD